MEVNSLYESPRDEERLFKRKEAKRLYRSAEIDVIRVFTPNAVSFFSSGSRGRSNPWCISRPGHWESYKSQGYEWVIVLLDKEKYAIDFNMAEGWDGENQPLTKRALRALTKRFPILSKLFPDSSITKADSTDVNVQILRNMDMTRELRDHISDFSSNVLKSYLF